MPVGVHVSWQRPIAPALAPARTAPRRRAATIARQAPDAGNSVGDDVRVAAGQVDQVGIGEALHGQRVLRRNRVHDAGRLDPHGPAAIRDALEGGGAEARGGIWVVARSRGRNDHDPDRLVRPATLVGRDRGSVEQRTEERFIAGEELAPAMEGDRSSHLVDHRPRRSQSRLGDRLRCPAGRHGVPQSASTRVGCVSP